MSTSKMLLCPLPKPAKLLLRWQSCSILLYVIDVLVASSFHCINEPVTCIVPDDVDQMLWFDNVTSEAQIIAHLPSKLCPIEPGHGSTLRTGSSSLSRYDAVDHGRTEDQGPSMQRTLQRVKRLTQPLSRKKSIWSVQTFMWIQSIIMS